MDFLFTHRPPRCIQPLQVPMDLPRPSSERGLGCYWAEHRCGGASRPLDLASRRAVSGEPRAWERPSHGTVGGVVGEPQGAAVSDPAEFDVRSIAQWPCLLPSAVWIEGCVNPARATRGLEPETRFLDLIGTDALRGRGSSGVMHLSSSLRARRRRLRRVGSTKGPPAIRATSAGSQPSKPPRPETFSLSNAGLPFGVRCCRVIVASSSSALARVRDDVSSVKGVAVGRPGMTAQMP